MNENTNEETTVIKKKKRCKPMTARLRFSKNFHKEDRMLDDYLDRTKYLNNGEKRCIRKLLKLRSREDGNTVKITYAGLTVLLGVDIKTTRRCLAGLVNKGFLYFDKSVVDPGFNYPKRVYSFPETFPGFDLRTIFTRKGAKVKYNIAMRKKRGKRSRVSSFLPKSTPPISALLVDCSNKVETSNSSEERTKVLPSSEIRLLPLGSATPPQRKVVQAKSPEGASFHHDGLSHLIFDYLKGHHIQRQFAYVARFFNLVCNNCKQYKTIADRQEVAHEMYKNFTALTSHCYGKRDIMGRLFAYIGDWVTDFCPTPTYDSSEYMQYVQAEAKNCPFDMPILSKANRMPYTEDIPDRPERTGMMGNLGNSDRFTDGHGVTYIYPNLPSPAERAANRAFLAEFHAHLSPVVSRPAAPPAPPA